MGLFSKSKDAGDAAEASVVFEVERGYGDRLFGKAKPVQMHAIVITWSASAARTVLSSVFW